MDWVDKLSMAAIGALVLVALGMLTNQELLKRRHHNPGSEAEEAGRSYALQLEADKKLYGDVRALKEQGLYAEAIAKLEELVKSYPDKSLSYVHLAQVRQKQGRLRDAIHHYRRAVEMDPDYVDERTPLFIGEDIRAVVEEGREKFGREKALKPDDKDVKQALEDVYYLQRRLAGGCE